MLLDVAGREWTEPAYLHRGCSNIVSVNWTQASCRTKKRVDFWTGLRKETGELHVGPDLGTCVVSRLREEAPQPI